MPPKKTLQRSLFACGVTSHVQLPSGRQVEIKGDDVVASSEVLKVGAFRCKSCDFFTSHAPALQVHVAMKHNIPPVASEAIKLPIVPEKSLVSQPNDELTDPAATTEEALVCVLSDSETEEEDGEDNADVAPKTSTVAATARPQRGQAKRCRYQLSFRRTCLDELDELKALGKKGALMEVAEKHGIAHANLVKWAKPKARRDLAAALHNDDRRATMKSTSKNSKKTHLHSGRTAAYKLAEKETHRLYKLHRQKGRRISCRWLKVQMKKQVRELHGEEAGNSFCASRGWFTGFIKRYNITLRKQSNSKGQSVEQRKPGIQQWHARLRHRVRRGKQVSPKWGRWLPECRYNVDQVPFTLADGDKRTYNDVGEKRVWISGSKKGDDKREATLQLCVCLSNSAQQPKATIIFRGKGLRIKQQERQSWDKAVNVLFQSKAWADNGICLHWATTIFPEAVNAKYANVLFCDNLSHQTTPEFADALQKTNTTVHLLKGNCTDEIQVIDCGIGKKTKSLMATQCDSWLEDDANLERWVSGKVSASERRILLTKWLATAWVEVCATTNFEKLGHRTGCLMTADGSEDNEIKPQGLPEYTFSNDDVGEGFIGESDTGHATDSDSDEDNVLSDADESGTDS